MVDGKILLGMQIDLRLFKFMSKVFTLITKILLT